MPLPYIPVHLRTDQLVMSHDFFDFFFLNLFLILLGLKHLDSMWIPHRMHGRVKAAPLPHILHGFTWNPCGILMDSRQSCSAEFPRIPWNLHGIRADSTWIPCTFLAGNTPIFLPTGMPGSTQNPWKFCTDSVDSSRNEWGRVKSSKEVPYY